MRLPRTLLLVSLCLALTRTVEAKSPLGEAVRDIDVAEHWIYDDWSKALAEAKSTGKPLLVVIRCVPCPPGKTLDLAVMQPTPALAEVEKQFVCVRLIQTNRLDLDLFQYDFDMSWSALFLNADRTIYGRYGSRDASGPNSDGLLSAAAFQRAAERALTLHADYPANKDQLAAKTGPKSEYSTPTEIPGLTARPQEATTKNECIHCHMVKEYSLRAKWEAGKLSADDLYVFPQPTALGLTMDIDDGLLVKSVASDSAASAAGIAPGDEFVTASRQPLVSMADLQWAMNAAPKEGRLSLTLRRDGKVLEKTIALYPGWKKYDIGWRASSWYGLRQGLKTEPLADPEKIGRNISPDRLALVVKNLYGKSAAVLGPLGLKKDDIIIAVDDQTRALVESDFLVWLRLNHGPKDTVKFTILRGSEKQELTLPMW